MSFISYWNEVKKRLEPCRFCGGGARMDGGAKDAPD